MDYRRKDADPPLCIEAWGWRYHHLGIPVETTQDGERYLPHLKFFVSGFDTSPIGVEWMRFEADCPIHPLIQKVPHLAFEVDDLDHELSVRGLEVLTPPNSPGEGTRVAMVVHNGAPIELIEFEKSSGED